MRRQKNTCVKIFPVQNMRQLLPRNSLLRHVPILIRHMKKRQSQNSCNLLVGVDRGVPVEQLAVVQAQVQHDVRRGRRPERRCRRQLRGQLRLQNQNSWSTIEQFRYTLYFPRPRHIIWRFKFPRWLNVSSEVHFWLTSDLNWSFTRSRLSKEERSSPP